MRTTLLISFTAVPALALALTGAARSGPASAAVGGDTTVTIQTFGFRPKTLEVRAGRRVTWVNQDDIEHTVTSGSLEGRDGQFSSVLTAKGATYGVSFTKAGIFTYFCDRHPFMRGEVHVISKEKGQ
jgi:plastocyanin